LRRTANLIPLLGLLFTFDHPAIAACTDARLAANSSGAAKLSSEFRVTSGMTYGSTACPGRFVIEVDVTGVKGSGETGAAAAWAQLPLSEQSCSSALTSASFYGFLPPTGNRQGGAWIDLGTKSSGGRWTKFFGGGTCETSVGVIVDTVKFTKVRVAGQASTTHRASRKVSVSVWNLQPVP
jgi:hypothetical protein